MKLQMLYSNSEGNTGIPIGTAYLIAGARREGHEVSLWEGTFEPHNYSEYNVTGKIDENGRRILKSFKEEIDRNSPDVIGVSTMSLGLPFAQKMIEYLGKDRPVTIFGGIGPTVDLEDTARHPSVDYVGNGYGEQTLPVFMKFVKGQGSLDDVPNLVYEDDGEIRRNGNHQEMDLANLPTPEWDLFDERHFVRPFKGGERRWGNFQLSRGCPFSCSYCAVPMLRSSTRMKYQKFEPEQIVGEIETLVAENDLNLVRLFDEIFGWGNSKDERDYYDKFARLYEDRVGLETVIETRPEVMVDPGKIYLLERLNCASASIGVESGNEEQRRKMLDRRVSNKDMETAFRNLHDAGINASSYNVMGFPHDKRSNVFETIELNRILDPDFLSIFLACPFPGTPLRVKCIEEGLLMTEKAVDYGDRTIIRNNDPEMTPEKLKGLRRVFPHYIKQPKSEWDRVKRAEIFDEKGNRIHKELQEEFHIPTVD